MEKDSTAIHNDNIGGRFEEAALRMEAARAILVGEDLGYSSRMADGAGARSCR